MYEAANLGDSESGAQEKAARQVLASLHPFSLGRAIAALRRLAEALSENPCYVKDDKIFVLRKFHYTDRPEDFEWHMYPVEDYCSLEFEPDSEDTVVTDNLAEDLLRKTPEETE